ncbi:hypothetical protein BDC45DRAFT_531741 [Circinella umbellata]|nr:hypothetical protein BDC45DRAFT_531741 [Circinella umbellata]
MGIKVISKLLDRNFYSYVAMIVLEHLLGNVVSKMDEHCSCVDQKIRKILKQADFQCCFSFILLPTEITHMLSFVVNKIIHESIKIFKQVIINEHVFSKRSRTGNITRGLAMAVCAVPLQLKTR